MVTSLASEVKSISRRRAGGLVTLIALFSMLSVSCVAAISTVQPQRQTTVESVSILDEVGLLSGTFTPATVASWKTQASGANDAQLQEARLRLAEYQLAHDQDPEGARSAFAQIEQSSSPKSIIYGTASYDSAVALYYEGAYRRALSDFTALMKERLNGVDVRRCALWARHADACAGYHANNAAIGIPEPPRLDPFCGAASLAEVLRSQGLNYNRDYVVKHCHVTGEGSTFQDIVTASQSMGLSAYPLTADDKGLIALHHSVVAFVERDHFVAVVRADKDGVSYLCSDCGPWPGGQNNVSWKQWHAMLPGTYLAVAQPGSEWDATLQGTLAQSAPPKPVRVSFVGDLGLLGFRNTSHLAAIFSVLRPHVFRLVAPGSVSCGNKPASLDCTPFIMCCKDCQKKKGQTHSSTSGDPVNLATGEEQYEPSPDLIVYNPVGPSIYWDRIYNSLRGPNATYQSDDFGIGWSTNYNMGVYDVGFGGTGTKYIVFSNGSRCQFTASTVPSATVPIVICTPQFNGFPLELEWTYDSSTTKNFYRIRSRSGAAWDTSETNYATVGGNSYYFPISKKYDVVGNALTFNYASGLGPSGLPILSSISNSRGTVLLTINRSGSYSNISSVTDSNGRSVYYSTATYTNPGVVSPNPVSYQELNQVSQVVATGTGSPPYRWNYYYGLVAIPDGIEEVNFLTGIGVPSPTASGLEVRGYISYNADTCSVSTVTDGNGNTATYTSVASNGSPLFPSTYTKVSLANSIGSVSYTYIAGYDTNMSSTSTTDGLGNVTEKSVYASTNDPYMPSSVTNANNDTWNYTWDIYGNLTKVTTPRSDTFNYTITHPTATYPIISQVTTEQEISTSGSHNPFNYTYYSTTNGFGGLVHTSVRPKPGAGGGAAETTTLTYDTLGNVTAATLPGNNAGNETLACNYTTDGTYSALEGLGLPLTVTDALGHTEHFRYDSRANTVSTIDPVGNETDFTFDLADDQLTAVLPASNQTGTGRSYTQNAYLYPDGPVTSTSLYNESGVLFRQNNFTYGLDGEALGVSGSTKKQSITYDSLFRTTSIADGLGNTTKYLYNSQGYLDSVLYPRYSGPTPVFNSTTGTWSNVSGSDSLRYATYDAAGNPLTRVDGNGVTTTYVYSDVESKLSSFSAPQVSFAGDSGVAYTRDAFGDILEGSDATQAGTSDGYVYDDYNNSCYTATAFAYPGMTTFTGYVEYFCNPDGSRSSVTSTAGTTTYSYDQGGRLLSLTNPYGEVYSWTYDNDSRILTQTSASSNVVTYTYNSLGQRTDIKYTAVTGGTLLCEFSSIVRNAAGQITSYTANMPGTPAYDGTTTFTYDNSGQLLSEVSTRNGGYSKTFAYDGSNTAGPGNPTTIHGTNPSFNADNQNTSYTVDGNGNSTSTGDQISYDNFSHAYLIANGSTDLQAANTRVDNGLQFWRYDYTTGGLYFFLYDGDAQTTYLYYTGAVAIYQTLGPNGYLNFRSQSVGGVLGVEQFYAFDPAGNFALDLNTAGSILGTTIVDAYGVSVISGINDDSGMQWGGGYYNSGITPYLLKARRYYDGISGRFLSRDPIGYEGGINQYAFVGNDPENNIDPSGLQTPDPDPEKDPIGGGRRVETSDPGLAWEGYILEGQDIANAVDQDLGGPNGSALPPSGCPDAPGEDQSGDATNDSGGGVTFTNTPSPWWHYSDNEGLAGKPVWSSTYVTNNGTMTATQANRLGIPGGGATVAYPIAIPEGVTGPEPRPNLPSGLQQWQFNGDNPTNAVFGQPITLDP